MDKNEATVQQVQPSGKSDPILGKVLTDLTNRALEGTKKYGEPLKALNGRNAAVDIMQELYDGAMYARQLVDELHMLGVELRTIDNDDVRAIVEKYAGLLG